MPEPCPLPPLLRQEFCESVAIILPEKETTYSVYLEPFQGVMRIEIGLPAGLAGGERCLSGQLRSLFLLRI